ncbi:heme NO-binding domain-containing protein [Bowmanella dokdonensis]|uniref:Heme NO-binding domain-containing protein n=1 Tax=Bowmanella dokdonensis TaxID=751969 RepID=A0A939IQD1_9ALTE|nr:heme NO-binding domain-containing protein [Bowmanella dokdonensis]MBN7826815.1 heme NO-binding domain-containing protein [Bowmanella dokdonensis]
MLGIVFTSFVEMVEQHFSPQEAEALLSEAGFSHGGAYTAVGYYPFEDLHTLLSLLSAKTGIAESELLYSFGKFLFVVLARSHESMLWEKGNLFELLACIDNEIHQEVRQLYVNADLPSFTVLERTERHMLLLYQSKRRLEILAKGLIEGAAIFYDTPVTVKLRPLDTPASGTLLEVRLF